MAANPISSQRSVRASKMASSDDVTAAPAPPHATYAAQPHPQAYAQPPRGGPYGGAQAYGAPSYYAAQPAGGYAQQPPHQYNSQNVPVYPQSGAPYPQSGAPYPQSGALYPHNGAVKYAAPPPPMHVFVPAGAAADGNGDGGYGYSQATVPAPSAFVSECEAAVRIGFIRKVFAILSGQLVLTFGMVAVFTFSAPVTAFVQSSPFILLSAFALSFGFLIALTCCPNVAKRHPTNLLCLLGFTLCEGYLVGTIASFSGSSAVIKAVGCTILLCTALTAFAFQTKIDFTAMSGALFCALMALLLFGLMCAIFQSEFLSNLYAGLGVLVFGLYLIYDVQLVIGGKHQNQFTIDDYVFAALSIYIDIVQIFLFLLRLFGRD